MDKKNTMLLTVVAIATLLVAVVGATFAYYSVTSSTLTNSTAINTQTGTTGTIAMSSSANTLCINMPVNNMANASSAYGTYYAATNGGTCAVSTKTEATHNIANITSTNSAQGQTYNCTFNTTITMADNNGETGTYAALGDDDGELILTLPSGVTITDVTSGTGIGFATLKNFGTKAGTATISGDANVNITAQMTFKNLQTTDQNDLKGANFNVSISFADFTCTSSIS